MKIELSQTTLLIAATEYYRVIDEDRASLLRSTLVAGPDVPSTDDDEQEIINHEI